jgi:hypothetical protein
MNINIIADENDNYMNGNIEFISEIYNDKANPSITLRKNESGDIGLHLKNWDCAESVDVFTGDQILELLECLFQANTFLKNMLIDQNNNQQNLFEETNIVREN